MISGFGSSSNNRYIHLDIGRHNSLPVPFNIQKVLHNLLFEEFGLEFNTKQADIIETLRFAYSSLAKIEKQYSIKESELRSKILQNSENIDIKEEYENLILDKQQANYDFKNLVELISDMLSREQFEKLLKFSNIPV